MGIRKIMDLHTHPEPYVTTSDLADYWGVNRKQIYKQIDAGTLAAIRLGPRLLRISTAEAIRFEAIAKMSPPPEWKRPSDRRDVAARLDTTATLSMHSGPPDITDGR
jgi:excisionase family DNA binding protein